MKFFRRFIPNFIVQPQLRLWWLGVILGTLMIVYSCDTTDSVKPNQGQTFIKLYGGSGSEEGKDLIQLPDGGFVLTGSSTSMSNGGKDIFVVRTDNLGNVVWENKYGGSGDDVGNSVILGSNNNIYVCGEKTQDSLGLLGFRDVAVLNLSLDNGSLFSEKIYGDVIRDEYGTNIIEIGNGFFISGTMSNPGPSQYYLIQTDSNLDTLQNSSRYTGTENVDNYSARSFEYSDPGNPFICFGTAIRSQNQTASYWFHAFTYKGNSDNLGQVDHYGTEQNNEFCTDAFQTTDGGYILGGISSGGATNIEMVVKVNPNLQEIWRHLYTNEFNKNIKECGIIQTKDGGYMVSSTIELDDPKNDEISLLKLNSEGEEQWRKTYGSNEDDTGSKVIQLDDGSYAVIGTIGFEINQDSQSKMCLMKINPNGDLVPIN